MARISAVKITRCPPLRPPQASRGFTLIEVMIAVAIVAILASVAYPAYQDSIRKGRRSEAFAALSAVQQAQERWRSNNASYAANSVLATAWPGGLGQASATASGYYGIAIATDPAPTGTAYIATATAASGTSQASDGNCKVIGVRMNGGNLAYGSGATSINWSNANPDAGRCWAR